MGTPVPPSIVAAFTFGGTVDVDYTIIPVASQVGVSPELASFATGFPPATRTPRTAGGIPPRGLDMNGILFMATGHIAWQAAGNGYVFNQDVVDTVGGYNIGAELRSVANPQLRFYNLVANNITDPDDAGAAGWAQFNPVAAASTGEQSEALAAGSQTVALDPGVGFLDAAAHASGSTVTDITGAAVGQVVTVTNDGAGNLTLSFVGITILAGESFTIRRRSSAWVPLS